MITETSWTVNQIYSWMEDYDYDTSSIAKVKKV